MDDECGAMRGMSGKENQFTRSKPVPSTALSFINLTSPELGLNPGRRGGKPETNLLSYG
jgi:hypothetical protein